MGFLIEFYVDVCYKKSILKWHNTYANTEKIEQKHPGKIVFVQLPPKHRVFVYSYMPKTKH